MPPYFHCFSHQCHAVLLIFHPSSMLTILQNLLSICHGNKWKSLRGSGPTLWRIPILISFPLSNSLPKFTCAGSLFTLIPSSTGILSSPRQVLSQMIKSTWLSKLACQFSIQVNELCLENQQDIPAEFALIILSTSFSTYLQVLIILFFKVYSTDCPWL